MKPERIQIFQRMVDETRSFAANLTAVLEWIEVAARELRRFFGLGGDGQQS